MLLLESSLLVNPVIIVALLPLVVAVVVLVVAKADLVVVVQTNQFVRFVTKQVMLLSSVTRGLI